MSVSESVDTKQKTQANLETIEKQLIEQYTSRLGQVKEIRTGLQSLLSELEKDDSGVKLGFGKLYQMIEEEKNKFKELSDRLEALKRQGNDEMKSEMITKTKEETTKIPSIEGQIKNGITSDVSTVGNNNGLQMNESNMNTTSTSITNNNDNVINESSKQFVLPSPVEIPSLQVADVPPLRERIHIEPFIRTDVPQHLVQINETPSTENDNKNEDSNEDDDELSGNSDTDIDLTTLPITEVETEEEDDTDNETEGQSEELKKLQAEETTSKLVGIDGIPPEVEKTLGKLKEFRLPEKPAEMKNLERDLRKMNDGLEGLSSEDRKYTKLVIIKHYDLLYRTFRRYCKIGGDTHWMTETGWVQMLLDCNVPIKTIEKCDKEGFEELFHRVFNNHQRPKNKTKNKGKDKLKLAKLGHQRSTSALQHLGLSEDAWTGIWAEDRGDSGAVETYRLKQAGDRKIVGCIKTSDYCEITGVLDQLDQSIANLVIKWYKGARSGQARKMMCQIKPPDLGNTTELAKMEIKWTAIEDGKSHASGNMMLHKISELDSEEGLPNTQGLARYEFWDAICLLVAMRWPELKRFAAIDIFCREHLNPYIWDPIETFDDKAKRTLIQKHKVSLRKLFTAYAGMDNDEKADDDGLGLEEWQLFCSDVFAVGAQRFKNGGKPSVTQCSAAFFLTLPELEEELDFVMFLKGLENLAQEMFKKRPKSKYQTPKVDERLKILVEEMCLKLHTKGGGPSQQKLTRMKTNK